MSAELSGYCVNQAHDDFEFVDGRRRDFRAMRCYAQVIIDDVIWHGTMTISSAHGCMLTVDTPRGYIRVTATDVFPGLAEALATEYAKRPAPCTLVTELETAATEYGKMDSDYYAGVHDAYHLVARRLRGLDAKL